LKEEQRVESYNIMSSFYCHGCKNYVKDGKNIIFSYWKESPTEGWQRISIYLDLSLCWNCINHLKFILS